MFLFGRLISFRINIHSHKNDKNFKKSKVIEQKNLEFGWKNLTKNYSKKCGVGCSRDIKIKIRQFFRHNTFIITWVVIASFLGKKI